MGGRADSGLDHPLPAHRPRLRAPARTPRNHRLLGHDPHHEPPSGTRLTQPATSLPRLSLLPAFGRGHGSAYAALAGGRIDADGLRDLLAAARPPSWPLVFAVDGTSWPRCDAETSPGRGYYYHPSRHSAGKPIVAGWWYQQISQLNFAADSWTWPVDCRRLGPREDCVMVTARQVRELLARLARTAA